MPSILGQTEMGNDKIYLADSKARVREKSGLQHSKFDELFSNFEVY